MAEVLEYHWGPDWLVWDAERTKQQYAQHVQCSLRNRVLSGKSSDQPKYAGATDVVLNPLDRTDVAAAEEIWAVAASLH